MIQKFLISAIANFIFKR